MKKIILGIVIGIVTVLLIGAGLVFAEYKREKAIYTSTENLVAPIEIPDVGIVEYNQVGDTEKPLVVLFYADWCTYCRRFMPEYGKTAKKLGDKYTFAVVNCDKSEYADMVRKFHILGFPSLFVVDNKLEHKFTVNMAATADLKIFQEELDNYLKFRENIINNLKSIDK